jgi:hypothetical protein
MEFRLDDGSAVEVDDGDVAELYDQLWLLVPRPGAVSVAAKLKHHRAWASRRARFERLDARESGALLDALDQMNRTRT